MSSIENRSITETVGGQSAGIDPPRTAWFEPASRLVAVLFSPGQAFQQINQKPSWLAPIIISVLSILIGGLLTTWKMQPDYEQIVRNRIQRRGTSQANFPSDQIIQRRAANVKTTAELSPIIDAIAAPIACLAIAGILAVALMLVDARTSFKKVLAVVAWSSCSLDLVSKLVRFGSVMVRDPESLRQTHPFAIGGFVPTNLAVLLPPDSAAPLRSLASSFDLFSIWFVILLAIGLAAIAGTRRITAGKAGMIVCGLWILMILAKIGRDIALAG